MHYTVDCLVSRLCYNIRVKSYIKTLFIFVSLLFSLIFGGELSNQNYSQILTAPISTQTCIIKNTFTNENSVVQTNNNTEHRFTKQCKRWHIFGTLSGLPFVQNIKSNFENFYCRLKFANNYNKYLSLYLRNEICTRAP